MSKTKKIIIAVVCLAAVCVGVFFLWKHFQPGYPPDADSKTVTVEVVHGDGSQKEFVIKTKVSYLRGALEEEKLVAGDEGQYGLFIKTADGETADESKQQWWCVTKGGEQVNTGVDTTPIADGETYELTLKTGW